MIIGIDASRANIEKLTGVERYAFEVIRRLPGLLPKESFVWYTREPLHERWGTIPSNVTVRVLRWPPRYIWTHLRLGWEIAKHRPDILFIPASAVPLLKMANTVATIHDIAFEIYPELYSRRNRFYQKWSLRHALRTCRYILTVSEFTKKEITAKFKYPAENIQIASPGVDIPDSDDDDRLIRTLPQSFALFIGRLEKKKNIAGLLKGYALYHEQVNNPLNLVLAGTPGVGWDEAKKNVPLDWFGKYIFPVGWVNDRQKTALEKKASLMIVPSFYEGFGIPPIESNQLGVPVVASNRGSLPEVLGDAAIYFSPENVNEIATAIMRVSTDQELRNQLVTAGKINAQRFSWDETANKVAKVFMEMQNLKK